MKKEQGRTIVVELTQRERDLIHTLAYPGYAERFQKKGDNSTTLTARFTADDLDDLLGYIAGEANHSKSKKIEKELDILYDKLRELEP